MSALDAAARRIASRALDADPGHPEAALWHAMMSPKTYAGMDEGQAVAVSHELARLWGEVLGSRSRRGEDHDERD